MVDDLTDPMRRALREMPLELVEDEHGVACLPSSGPSGGTIRALKQRGLIKVVHGAWRLTAAGVQARERTMDDLAVGHMSSCCHAGLAVESGGPDFAGDASGSTSWFVCVECEQPCNMVAAA